MKKFNLAIPKPCHENWEQMTKEEKGRFCGSCQKTVIDFTHMSDRELADFFKKPMGSICGRFQKDQLNREIIVPKKPIPWLRHFIHIAWPAFLLMLKSCGQKDRVSNVRESGMSVTNTTTKGEYEAEMMGVVLTPLKEADTLPPPPRMGTVVTIQESVEIGEIMGDIAMLPIDTLPGQDSVIMQQGIEAVDSTFIALDTVTVNAASSATKHLQSIVCGGVTYNITEVRQPESSNSITPDVETLTNQWNVYPNPVRAGRILNLKFSSRESVPLSVQLLTANGQRVLYKVLNEGNNYLLTTITLPANLPGGIYFIKAIYPNGATVQSRVLVSH